MTTNLATAIDNAQRAAGRRPAKPRQFSTRKPTGRPSWPLTLVAGGKKCGKSYTIAELSAAETVGRTFVVEVGEGSIDQYGSLPGARFELVEHDGSYDYVCDALSWASAQPAEDGRPNVLALDGGTVMWDLLSGEQQLLANQRVRARHDATISSDQWNTAKARWGDMLDILRLHQGPSIITARLEEPTEGSEWGKLRAEKNLAYEADLVIYIPRVREHWITGVRSQTLVLPEGENLRYPRLTLADVYADMGLTPDTVGPRHYTAPRPAAVQE